MDLAGTRQAHRLQNGLDDRSPLADRALVGLGEAGRDVGRPVQDGRLRHHDRATSRSRGIRVECRVRIDRGHRRGGDLVPARAGVRMRCCRFVGRDHCRPGPHSGVPDGQSAAHESDDDSHNETAQHCQESGSAPRVGLGVSSGSVAGPEHGGLRCSRCRGCRRRCPARRRRRSRRRSP